jgi:hypothetical protein
MKKARAAAASERKFNFKLPSRIASAFNRRRRQRLLEKLKLDSQHIKLHLKSNDSWNSLERARIHRFQNGKERNRADASTRSSMSLVGKDDVARLTASWNCEFDEDKSSSVVMA